MRSLTFAIAAAVVLLSSLGAKAQVVGETRPLSSLPSGSTIVLTKGLFIQARAGGTDLIGQSKCFFTHAIKSHDRFVSENTPLKVTEVITGYGIVFVDTYGAGSFHVNCDSDMSVGEFRASLSKIGAVLVLPAPRRI